MVTLKGHFDGTAIVLDEPANLSVGQAVEIVVKPQPVANTQPADRRSILGFAKGEFGFVMSDDFDAPLDEFAEYR